MSIFEKNASLILNYFTLVRIDCLPLKSEHERYLYNILTITLIAQTKPDRIKLYNGCILI